jgi:predicted dehydrogenase
MDRVEVVAAADMDLAKAQAVAERFTNCRAAKYYQDIVGDCDAALIVLPHHLHYQAGLDFLYAGKHVLMEKPLANTELECLDLIEAANKQRRVLMCAYCMRFHPMIVKIKELLDARTYGEVFQVSIWTEQHTQRAEVGEYTWIHKAATLGGGQFFSHGCHYVDILLAYLGRPVKGVHFGSNKGTPWMQHEGTSNASFEFENGVLGYHFGTWGAKGTRLGYSVHAHCTQGMIEGDISHGKLYFHSKGKVEELMGEEDCMHAGDKYTHLEVGHFVDCIAKGQRPLTDAPKSLQSLRVIWRMYEAERRNEVADLRGLGFDQVGPDGRLI